MALTTAQAFDKCLEELTATDWQKTSFIPARKASVDKDLTAGFPSDSDMPFLHVLLMGSAKKNTIIRPLDDIDVLAVFSNDKNAWAKYQFDSQSFLYRVRKIYSGFHAQQVGARGQAVRVFYQTGGHVDIAPVFATGNGVFVLPAGDGTWIRTAPETASSWFSAKDRALTYNLAPLVRLLKAWNRAHSKRMQSFHLETIAASIFNSLGSDRRDAIHKFFQWGQNSLDVSDPGGQGGLLSGYLSYNTRLEVIQSMQRAAEQAGKAIEAESKGNHTEAKRLWRIIIGDAFPIN